MAPEKLFKILPDQKFWIGASVYLLWFFVSTVVAWAVLGK
jgi:hypothetical protein